MRKIWLMALVAACAPVGGAPVPEAPVRVAAARDAAWPPARGEAELIVRAVSRDAGGVERELVGARCAAASPFYSAEFSAPARVLVPDFGSASPTVGVTCRAGEAQGRAEARPELVGSRGFYGFPAVGVSVGTGDHSGVGVGVGWYGGGTTFGAPAVRYRSVRVVMD